MDSLLKKAPLLIFGLLFFVSTVAAIKCHICNSKTLADCASTEKILSQDSFLQDCSHLHEGQKYTYCRKIEQDIPASNGNEAETRIIRECGYYNTSVDGGCYKAGLINGGRQVVCSCANEDGCNGADTTQTTGIFTCLFLTFLSLVGHKLF